MSCWYVNYFSDNSKACFMVIYLLFFGQYDDWLPKKNNSVNTAL